MITLDEDARHYCSLFCDLHIDNALISINTYDKLDLSRTHGFHLNTNLRSPQCVLVTIIYMDTLHKSILTYFYWHGLHSNTKWQPCFCLNETRCNIRTRFICIS